MFFDQLRQVFRRLAKAPLFTLVTLLTLAVGIGANTVVFSVVESVLLKPLAYPAADRLIGVWHRAPGVGLQQLNMAPFLYFIYREQNKTLDDIGAYNGDAVNITGAGQPEHIGGVDVTDGLLPLLGAKPALGRLFTREDDGPNAPKTMVISYGYWQRKFGGSKSVIGSSITADGTARTIIGVLPRGFQFLDYREAQIFLPMQWDRSKTKLGNFSYQGIARLRPGVPASQAQADLARLLPIALHSFPAPEGFSADLFEKAQFAVDLHPLKQDVIGNVGNVLWVLMGSIGLVLLVACANVANLLLVRVEGRRQELAVRAALGAGRGRIMAGILVESTAVGFVGSAIGLALAYGALRILVAAAPTGLPRLSEIGIDLPVLGFALGLAAFVSLVIGMIPVLRYAGENVQSSLREGGRSQSQGRERHRARKTLVVVQVALALVLLICSGLMIRTFRALMQVNPGFTDPASLQTFRVYIPESQIPDAQAMNVVRMFQTMMGKVAAVPGVTAVGLSSAVPMDGFDSMDPVFAQDHVYKEGELPPIQRFKFISPGFFAAMGTKIAAGRDLTWDDTYTKRPVVVVSESTARQYWGSTQAALGKHVRVGSTDDWREVIGVAQDVHDDGVDKPASTAVYWPIYMEHFEGQPVNLRRGLAFAVRSSRAGSSTFMSELQRAVWSIDADVPLANPTTSAELFTKSMARTSFTLVILCVAGGMSLLLGIVGIYGVISYAVSQRTREIGIRMALGAQKEQLTALFVRQGLALAGIGIAAGLVIAALALRLMSSLLFGVKPIDPFTYGLATICILVIAWLACYLPSRSAAVVNPVKALRAE